MSFNWNECFDAVTSEREYLGFPYAVRLIGYDTLPRPSWPCGYVAVPSGDGFPVSRLNGYRGLDEALSEHHLTVPHGGTTYYAPFEQDGHCYAIFGFDFNHAGDENVPIAIAENECKELIRNLCRLNSIMRREREDF